MNLKISKKLVFPSLFAIILLSILLYKNSLGAYFFQDDWFTLKISDAKNISAVAEFFIPRTDVIYFRPLGMQTPFFILRNLFGINPLPLHILTIITHSINILLVYFLIKLIRKNILVSLISAFVYGTSTIHYIPMFWSATYAFVLGPSLFFLSLILFISSLNKTGRKLYFFSIISFIFGLLTNEMIAVLPVILLVYQVYTKRIDIKKLVPYFLLVLSMLFLRFYLKPPPIHGTYQISLSKEVLINLRAYFLWSFNWPEEMKAQFVSFWKINNQFIKDFPWYFWSFIITFFVSTLFFYIIPLLLNFVSKKRNFFGLFLFSSSWFAFGLLPVIFFPAHSFSYYLPISLVGLMLYAVSSFVDLTRRIYSFRRSLAFILVALMLINWFYSAFVTIEFNSKVHWAPRRAAISKSLVDNPKNNSSLILTNTAYITDTSENKLALNDQDALRVIYNNDRFKTIYGNPPEK